MTVLKASLYGQVVWFACATLYNVLSLLAIANGDAGFAGDQPTTRSAMFAVMIFGAVTLSGILGRMTIFKVLAPIVTVTLLVGGVIKHVGLGPAGYASEMHWFIAILINSGGVIAYTFGVFAAFRKR